MKILLTGATGFVGQHILEKLSNHEVLIVLRQPSKNLQNFDQVLYDNDLDNFQKKIKLFNPEVVIHLASFLTSSDDVSSIKNVVESNILFTSLLLEAMKETNIKLFINTGTFAEYYYNDGVLNPAYFYSASKIASRSIIKYFQNIINFKTVNIIPYTIYGGRSKSKKVIDYIADSITSPQPVDMTSGDQILDFIHINDVVDFYLHCIENIDLLHDGSNYHLGTGKGTKIKELATLLEQVLNKRTNINWGAREYRKLDIMRAIAPIYKLEKELNWKPKISLEKGLKEIYDAS